MAKANMPVRVAMLENGVTQNELAEGLGIYFTSLSGLLKYELAESEQNKMIDKVKEIAAQKGA